MMKRADTAVRPSRFSQIILSLAGNFFLILLNASDVLIAHGHIVLEVEVIEHSAERHRLGLFHESEALEVLSVVLVFAEFLLRLEESLEDALLCGACTDDVSTDAVDGSIEVVKAHVCAVERVGAYQFLEEVERLALMEEAKSMPFGAVFDYFNLKNNVPVGEEYIAAIQKYEKDVTSKRN